MNNKKLYDRVGQAKKISIYPVGFFRDVSNNLILRWNPRQFLFWFSRSWDRKSYWNCFLAEPYKMPEGYHVCGSGILPILALWDLYKKTDGFICDMHLKD